jgi:histidinol-phosphate aminotransferase/imidazoleglycerol-phosphate dehydratase/histidinol-phosphatase
MRGADEAIDCLMRAFCVPPVDNIIICPPTFAMYRQSAILQGVKVREAPLANGFALDTASVLAQCDDNTKLVFVCSPNNPTANLMDRDAILNLCAELAGRALVVVDETYIEYAGVDSIAAALESHANLVVLRTLSKSHAAAGVRCGVAVARADVSELLAKVLAPYPIPQPVVQAVMAITAPVREVLPTDANYLLMIVDDADALCARAGEAGVILRNQSHQPGLANAVRVSIGTEDEMDMMLAILRGEAVSAPGEERIARHVRRTSETAISVEVNLDRKAPVRISTGVGFYDHMLDQIAKHAGFSLQLECDGDLHIDPHHTIEDCAIALGVAIRSALGDKRGVGRYGFCLPMDESLVTVALDLSGRYYLDFKGDFPADHVGDLPTDMIEHVFRSLAENLQANLHIAVEGENAHHMVEACFKGFARALRQAIRQDGAELPSTKGVL